MRSWTTIHFRLLQLRRSESGGAALELAIVLPILVLLAMGAADFGRLYFNAIAVADAAKAGAQYGARDINYSGDTASMTAQAVADASPVTLDTVTSSRFCRCSNGSTPSCTGSCSGYGVPQVFVAVRVRKTFNTLFKYPGILSAVPVIRTATIRIQ